MSKTSALPYTTLKELELWRVGIRYSRTPFLTAFKERVAWASFIVEVLHMYRATPHATMRMSPFELLFGRKMRTQLTVLPQCNVNPAMKKHEKKITKDESIPGYKTQSKNSSVQRR